MYMGMSVYIFQSIKGDSVEVEKSGDIFVILQNSRGS